MTDMGAKARELVGLINVHSSSHQQIKATLEALTEAHREGAESTGVMLRSDGKALCLNCCWGDRCDEPTHRYRKDCPVCKGAGALTKEQVQRSVREAKP